MLFWQRKSNISQHFESWFIPKIMKMLDNKAFRGVSTKVFQVSEFNSDRLLLHYLWLALYYYKINLWIKFHFNLLRGFGEGKTCIRCSDHEPKYIFPFLSFISTCTVWGSFATNFNVIRPVYKDKLLWDFVKHVF